MPIPLYVVDAFTDHAFSGNPAAVCVLDRPGTDAWMQSVAAEMKHSETAFLHPDADGYALRWFTPSVEVTLCGHATLASAHTLWESGREPATRELRFSTASGTLVASNRSDRIELDFPAKVVAPVPAPDGFLAKLGIADADARTVARNDLDYLVEVADERSVLALTPDPGVLRSLPARGVIVTALASRPGADFVSRFFAPGAGVDEDPVTGSAHCALAPFWSARLGRTELVGYQASERGGTVRTRVAGDRVVLGGRAVTVLRGELVAQR